MITADSDFIAQKNASRNQPIFLYIIEDYNDLGGNLYYAEYDVVVSYKGITYNPFPVTHEFTSENSTGEIDQVRLRIANVNRAIQGYIENIDWRGKKVTIRLVWANKLSDPDAYLDFIYYIDNYNANEKVVDVVLTSKLDILDFTLPNRKYSRNFCSWKFKGTECGYAGAETECNRTRTRCKALSNGLRFGAFPSVPLKRLYV